jgi:hypothetical protein
MVWSYGVVARYGPQVWTVTVMLSGRRVIRALFTRLGFDEDTGDKPLPKVLECHVGYGGPET